MDEDVPPLSLFDPDGPASAEGYPRLAPTPGTGLHVEDFDATSAALFAHHMNMRHQAGMLTAELDADGAEFEQRPDGTMQRKTRFRIGGLMLDFVETRWESDAS